MPGTLSFRDVEDLLAERGIVVSYETVRRWVKHVGSMIAADLRRRRPKPHSTWHLDEGFTKIDGRLVYLWRAVDAEGEVLDVLVQSKLDKRAAQKDLIIGCRYRIGGVLGTAGTPFSAHGRHNVGRGDEDKIGAVCEGLERCRAATCGVILSTAAKSPLRCATDCAMVSVGLPGVATRQAPSERKLSLAPRRGFCFGRPCPACPRAVCNQRCGSALSSATSPPEAGQAGNYTRER